MIYFIGYLVKGEAKNYHEILCSELSEKFKIRYLPDTVPSHITLKAPFQTDKIFEVEKIIEEFIKKEKITKIRLDGINHFGNGVVFIDAKASEEMMELYGRLFRELKDIDWMSFGEFDGENVHFHLTVATKGIQNKFEKIMDYLKDRHPVYDIEFDNIAILIYEKGKWQVHKEYEIA